MLESLSPRQRQFFDCFAAFMQREGRSPTNAELAREVGVSPTAAQNAVRYMYECGVLEILNASQKNRRYAIAKFDRKNSVDDIKEVASFCRRYNRFDLARKLEGIILNETH